MMAPTFDLALPALRSRTGRNLLLLTLLLFPLAAACGSPNSGDSAAAAADYPRLRQEMVADQLRARDIWDRRVLEAMGKVSQARVRAPGRATFCVRGPPLAYRPGTDHFPALHRRSDDPVGGSEGGRPGAGNRNRFRLPGGGPGGAGGSGLHHRDRPRAGPPVGGFAQAARLRKCSRPGGRRLSRVARGGSLRRHPGDGRGRPGSRAPSAAIGRGRTPRHSRG